MGHQPGSREKILQSAKELFYQHGYQITSVDDILRKAAVAKSNFYYHFKTKEDLGREVLELWIAEQEAEALQLLQNADLPPPERLNRFFVQVRRAQAEGAGMAGCPFGNFAASLPNTEEDARHERFRLQLRQLFRRMEVAMHGCLSDGIARGDFRSDLTPVEMAAFLLATVQGLLLLTKTYKDTAPLEQGFFVLERLIRAKEN